MILSSVVLQPLWEAGYRVDFLTLKPFDQLFQEDYRLSRVIGVDRSQLKSLRDIVRFAKTLGKYDYVLDLHKNLRSFIMSIFIDGKVFRYKKNSIKRRFRRLDREFNVVRAYLKPLENLNIRDLEKYRPKLILSEKEVKKFKKELPERFISIGTGARYKNKVYPLYHKVAEILVKQGYNIVLVGSDRDKEMDRGSYSKGILDLRGKLSIRESLAVISKGVLTISNDSAVAHMSRAVGVPVLMVYGATHPYLGFSPLEDEGGCIFKNLPCQPCDIHGKGECKRGDLACLTSIAPAEIAERALGLIG